MTDPDCIFCKIVAGEIPSDRVYTGDRVIAFRDINPVAPVHILVVPVDHHPDVVALAEADDTLLHELVTVAGEIAKAEAGGQFRLVFNTGADAGQSVFHVHGHVIAGRMDHLPG
ncbi:histidine triad nucleotide-binding protein [Spongisporangium articulatum]|uniref:Histidine triad nucleotide-binding protein n=1 Tax=Spongisporangium articulatum TaxID=3362603 RepID=A0ABW8AM11_9ACTN